MAGSMVTDRSNVRKSPSPSAPSIRSCPTISRGSFTVPSVDTKWPCQNQRIHSSSGLGVTNMASSQASTDARRSIPALSCGS